MEVKVKGPITAAEYQDTFHFLISLDQKLHYDVKKNECLVTQKISIKLITINMTIYYLVLSGRVKNFPIGFTSNSNVPVLSYSKLSRLVVLYHHNRHHRDVDTTVTVVRSDVWPIKVRKLATSIDSKCVDCKIKRRQPAGQSMGDLPSFRTDKLN